MDKKYWTNARLNRDYHQWSNEYIEQLKSKIDKSKWRLGYHIQANTGLLNDPNGFSYFNNQWHLFYQSFPFGAVHGLKSWSHLISDDLVHWKNTYQPMIPDNINDKNGCYSGSAIPIGDHLFLMYTGNIWDNKQRIAKQDGAWMDKHNNIQKLSKPLIANPPKGVTGNFRDPQIIQRGNYYYAFIGAQTTDRIGEILVYRSQYVDRGWKYFNQLDIGNKYLGYMVECPNLIFIHGHPVILFCPQGMDHERLQYDNIYPNTYIAGDSLDWENMKIINPSKIKQLDYGFDFYATEALNSPDGRALSISWIGLPDVNYVSDSEGWSGALSMVKELKLENGNLIQYPAKENMQLIDNKVNTFNGMEIPKQSYLSWQVEEAKNSQLAITSDVSHLYIIIDHDNDKLIIHRQNNDEEDEERSVNLNQDTIEECELFLDNSVFELYINGGLITMTGRYFSSSDNLNLNWTDCSNIKVSKMKLVNVNLPVN